MSKVRKFEDADLEVINAMYLQQNYDYQMPDFTSPIFSTKMVLEEDGKVEMFAGVKLSAEAYFLMNREWGTPSEKWASLQMLHEATRIHAYGFGLENVNCWLPPQIERTFGRRLMRLGWERNLWQSYSRELQPVTVDLRARERVMV